MTEHFRLNWPVEKHVVNQAFGENPGFYQPFGLPGHEGIDFFAPMNAAVFCAADGEVYRVNHPPDHPYGLQIRIKHERPNGVYRTVYAHLAKAFVIEGEHTVVGQRIGLADNTGNSFGSHLHLTLKIDGAQTPGYPPGIVDPWPFFRSVVEVAPLEEHLVIYPTALLSLRARADSSSDRIAILQEGQPLMVLGDVHVARSRVGRDGEWIMVQTEDGKTGHVAAWFVRLTGQAAPVSSLVVFPSDVLSVRARPSVDASRLVTVCPDDPLTVLGDALGAGAKIGQFGQWLNIKTPSGHVGYVAAWFVRHRVDAEAPLVTPAPSAFLTLTVLPSADLNLRAQPTVNSPRVGGALANTTLNVLDDDPNHAREKVGQEGQWLFVETESGDRGWAAAWFLRLSQS